MHDYKYTPLSYPTPLLNKGLTVPVNRKNLNLNLKIKIMAELKSLDFTSLSEVKNSSSFKQQYKAIEGSECSLDVYDIPEDKKYGLQARVEHEGKYIYFAKKNDEVVDFEEGDTLVLTMFEALCDITSSETKKIVLQKGDKKYFITGVI